MLGVGQVEGDSSLNLTKSLVLGCSSTGHCSPEKPEAEACVFALHFKRVLNPTWLYSQLYQALNYIIIKESSHIKISI